MKLCRVLLKGMYTTGVSTKYGSPYVVADNPSDALKKVQEYLTERDIGFVREREMKSIELLAEEGDYPDCNIQLFL